MQNVRNMSKLEKKEGEKALNEKKVLNLHPVITINFFNTIHL